MAQDFDGIRASSPIANLDGTETFVIQKQGITSGGFLSMLRAWVIDNLTIPSSKIEDASSIGRELITAGNANTARTAIGASAVINLVNQQAAEDGTSETVAAWSPLRVRQANQAYSDPKRIDSIELTANTTASATHLNRLVQFNAAAVRTFTLPSTGTLFSTRDVITLVNLGTASVTITGGVSLKRSGTTGTITSYELPANALIRLHCVGPNAWFLEV